MLEKITDDELELMECLAYPISATECIFSDLDNFLIEDENQFAEVRLAQVPMLSFEYMITDDPDLGQKANFKLKENLGRIDCFGGRKFGKTHIVEKVDLFLSMIWLDGWHVGFTSLDALHIRGILEDVIKVVNRDTGHTFYRMFDAGINRSPNYRITLKNAYVLESINMNIQSKQPGAQFFQKHLKRLYIEEASFETEEVYNKRIEAVSEDGCIVRSAGMTNFTKYSPAGRRFYDLENRKFVCNLPQYCNPKWDENEKKRATREHGGEASVSYRIFVKGEVVEEGISVFDMERVRRHYLDDKIVKKFEITKENFVNFENIIVVERPTHVDEIHIYSDIGESAATEIIILFRKGETYRYTYNITTYNLTDKQQPKIFEFLVDKLSANIVGIDTTDGTGRSIYRTLNMKYPVENLVWCAFNEKIRIEFERDSQNNVIYDNAGTPVYKEEYVSEWSIKCLKDLFYEGRLKCPIDYKLDKQLNSVVAEQTGTRTVYSVVGGEDHLVSAFRVAGIGIWQKEFNKNTALSSKKFCKTGV